MSDTLLDPALFADGPARDERFVVKQRWAECENLPLQHPRKLVEFLHRQMNEEINGIENSARCLSDFPDAEWELRMSIARQCADEARHVLVFRRLLEARGGRVGEFPVLNFQYRIVTRIGDLLGRLAVQNRAFEAEGIDAIGFGIEEARAKRDDELAALFEAQLADEIGHVRYANEWLERLLAREPGRALRVAAALDAATRGFRQVMGTAASTGARYGVNAEGRLEAGFDPEEVRLAEHHASDRSAG